MAGASRYRMVDVGDKPVSRRRAIASGRIRVGRAVITRLQRDPELPKGDPLRLAEVAAIMAAKQAPHLLPLCHSLVLDQVRAACRLDTANEAVEVFVEVTAGARTGVEMEAVVGANAALMTIWDLVKPIEPALTIEGVRLLLKEGGKSGCWRHPGGLPDLPVDFAAPKKQEAP